MDGRLLEILVDPQTKRPLRLRENGADPLLETDDGRSYPVRNGIPRFVGELEADQAQTEQSFGFKWKWREFSDSQRLKEQFGDWVATRYGFSGLDEMREYFEGRERILDAGCGAGYSSSMWLDDSWRGGDWVGADISEAIDVAQERLGSVPGTGFVQADVLQLPFDCAFDTVFSEGVFHHTPSTRAALACAVGALRSGGEILFYVYRRKSPVREFTDDHVRDVIAGLDPEAALEALRPLTRLGQALAELEVEVEVPEAVPVLGIEAGRFDVQRLIYWNFAKLFWNPALSFEENLHINFDWYHPRYAHRHDPEEVRGWCEELDLTVSRLHVDEAGITVRATKA
jgi:SAM-dependent methyltransferase